MGDERVTGVMSFEGGAVLAHSLSKTSACFSYIDFTTSATVYAIYLAEWAGVGYSLLFDEVAYLLPCGGRDLDRTAHYGLQVFCEV